MLGIMVLASALSLSAAGAPNAKSFNEQDLDCMALNIYWEARGESEVGQRAVAHVVLNRTQASEFPSTICGVVKQGRSDALHACQFSWWCDGRSDRPRDFDAWRKALEIARDVTSRPYDDPSNGALFFHNVLARPEWRKELQVVARIGDHIFYAPVPGQPGYKSVMR